VKLVRKLDRKRYYGMTVYEYERILVPIPAKKRELVRPWIGRDLEIRVETLSYGFAVLVTDGKRYINGVSAPLRFRRLMKEMEPDSGGRINPR